MEQWESSLHWSFRREHVLISSIRLSSFSGFLAASLLTIALCTLERFISFSLDKHWGPHAIRRSRLANALWRASLYWLATAMRLCYMLITMTFHLGLLMVVVTTLAVAQFLIELHNYPQPQTATDRDSDGMAEPLLREDSYALSSRGSSNSRSKPKPEDIFIHPAESNIARADAAALELGLSGNTERVQGNFYAGKEAPWEAGTGRDAARALLGPGRTRKSPSFHIGDPSDSDSSDG